MLTGHHGPCGGTALAHLCSSNAADILLTAVYRAILRRSNTRLIPYRQIDYVLFAVKKGHGFVHSDIANYQKDFRNLTELKYSILCYRIASVDGTNNTKSALKKYGTASSSQGISDYLLMDIQTQEDIQPLLPKHKERNRM